MDGKRATGGGARTYSADDKLIFDAMSYRLNVPTQALTNLVTSHRKVLSSSVFCLANLTSLLGRILRG